MRCAFLVRALQYTMPGTVQNGPREGRSYCPRSAGIISALRRTLPGAGGGLIEDILQTDAAINKGWRRDKRQLKLRSVGDMWRQLETWLQSQGGIKGSPAWRNSG